MNLMTHLLSEKDNEQILSLGTTPEKINRELNTFKKGIDFVHIEAPCTPGHGIDRIGDIEIHRLTSIYENAMLSGRAMKFTPASGAASRMFRLLLSLYNDLEQLRKDEIAHRAAKGESEFQKFLLFFDNIEKFSFFDDLKNNLSDNGLNLNKLLLEKDYKTILEYLLTEKGLNYSNTPKGLIPFHQYGKKTRTPFEEHLAEAVHYIKDKDHICNIHFTINDEYSDLIKEKVEASLEQESKVQFHITYSSQLPSTDTIAADLDNNPFRNSGGELLFRPAGHGALLENLNAIKGDIVFIKNIDNVAPDSLKESTIRYKKALGGYLVEIQVEIFKILKKIELKAFDSGFIQYAFKFMEEKLSISIPEELKKRAEKEKATYIFSTLNRPIRVCGMVKNEGEPGGGPFWVKNSDGTISCQIIEKAQIDLDNKKQKQHFDASTHFNPVDLVCSIRDYQGKKFNLTHYVDPNTGFISEKSVGGKSLKALELPGLWNGAMARWLTLFVEVPVETFSPVKTVFDLVRQEHRA